MKNAVLEETQAGIKIAGRNINNLRYAGRRQWHPTPVLLPGKSHGRRSLEGCSPWGHWGLDTTEWLHFHFSLSHTGGGNGNPLQCSCLENPRDGGAWWAAIYGVAQSRTRLKRLSSSSSSYVMAPNRLILEFMCLHAKLFQSCLTLYDPMDDSLPGSSVSGILQERMLEWVAVPSSRRCFWPRDQTPIS